MSEVTEEVVDGVRRTYLDGALVCEQPEPSHPVDVLTERIAELEAVIDVLLGVSDE